MPGRDQRGPCGNGPEGWGRGPCKDEVSGGWFGFGRRPDRRGGAYFNRRGWYNRRSEPGKSEKAINTAAENEPVLMKILDRLDAIEKRLKS